MFLIVGLGNPGLAYAHTRHNVGFLFLNNLAFELGFPEFHSKFDSLYSEKTIDRNKFILQKPQTFMNLSGNAVLKIASFFKIKTQNIFVVHDDIDLDPLNVRIKFAGGHGGHNGLRDIDRAIGKEYWRIRIGVGRPERKEDVSDYVLSNFYQDELKKIISTVFEKLIANTIELLLAENKEDTIKKITKEING